MVIDSNIFIDHLRAKNKLKTKFYQLLQSEKAIFVSTVSVYEIYSGAATLDKQTNIQVLLKGIVILPFEYETSIIAAQIFNQLKVKSQLIEFRDIFIAATCLVHHLPIVTLNKKHFERIEGLEVV